MHNKFNFDIDSEGLVNLFDLALNSFNYYHCFEPCLSDSNI